MQGANTMTNATVTSNARAQARSTSAEGTVGKMVQESADHRMMLTYKGGEKAVIVPNGAGVTPEAYLPVLAGTVHVWRARSGLMRVQL